MALWTFSLGTYSPSLRSKSYSKERLEVFSGGRILQLDNFRRLAFGWPELRKMNMWRQDKGQTGCALAFVRAVEQGGSSLRIPAKPGHHSEASRAIIPIDAGPVVKRVSGL